MILSRKLIVAGGLGCIVGLIAFRWESRRLEEIRTEAAAIQRQLSAMRAELQTLQDRLAALRPDRNRPLEPVAQANSDPPAGEVPGVGTPEELRKQAIRDHAKLGLKYLPLYEALHLTAEQGKRITALFAAFQTHRADILVAADAQGLTRQDPAINSMILQEGDRLKADITAVVGADGYAQWLAYRRDDPVHGLEQGPASGLYYTSAPLTQAETAQLTPLLSVLRPANSGAGRGAFDLYAIDPAQLRTLSGTVLSTPQMAALDDGLAAHQAAGQLQVLLDQRGQGQPAAPAQP